MFEDDPRVAASFARLQAADYDVEPVLRDGAAGAWPGDYPGRLILALSRLAGLTDREPRQLHQLVTALPDRLNKSGYLGPVQHDLVDEQQLAGHGWLVSGLLAHYRLTGEARSRDLALQIVASLMLPTADLLADYPRRHAPQATAVASGAVVGRHGRWLLSSDTYCVFIALEGLVAAFAETGDREVASLIGQLTELIRRDDLVASGAQLHATLTGARCLLEHGEQVGRADLIATAVELYDRYATHGRTANDATWNWFGRPESWTEPCAIVDALLLALGLWRATGDVRYLDDALSIEHNALGYAQKAHGGFGLDSITGAQQHRLFNKTPDAAWCCTMRGAVGLAEARERSYRVLPDGTVSVELYRPGRDRLELPTGTVHLNQQTTFPLGGRVSVELVGAPSDAPVPIRLVRPSWAGGGSIRAGLRVGERVTADLPVTARTEPIGDGAVRVLHGSLLLGARDAVDRLDPLELRDPDTARYHAGGTELRPVREAFNDPDVADGAYQIVFGRSPVST